MSNLKVDKISLEISPEEAITIGCAVARVLPKVDSKQGSQGHNQSMRKTIIQLLTVAYGYDATSLVDSYAKEEQQ